MRLLVAFVSTLATLAAAPAHERLDLAWPTPNPAWAEGKGIEAFIQPTVSGDPRSGCFGCVRDNGFQFHEGLDLKPVKRDARGEPEDEVFSVLPGIVRHVSLRAAASSYGRYIVIEHPGVEPSIYTLYAHLSRVLPGIRDGVEVARGQPIAIMGHTAGGYAIPRDRAHTHFEMGLMMTLGFQSWYDRMKFGSPNEHGIWNGMNLMGFDPLDFYNRWRAHEVDNFLDYFRQMKAQVRLRVVTPKVPDFIRRYPCLLTAPLPAGPIGGWEISCDWTGLPFAWQPLTPMEVVGQEPGQVTLLDVDRASVISHRAKVLVRRHGKGYVPGPELDIVLAQLFGFR